MTSQPEIQLNGMTWSHERAIAPLKAVKAKFQESHPAVSIQWSDRPLHCFESQPLDELVDDYDLIVIDHPHLGEAVRNGHLIDLADRLPAKVLADLAAQSVGQSHKSYALAGGHWALAIDAATPVASFRPDAIAHAPATLAEARALAAKRKIAMPLKAPHALIAFFWIARNNRIVISDGPGDIIGVDGALHTLDLLRQLTETMNDACLTMDPIEVYEAMAAGTDGPVYCPHAYGYINYGHAGFRPQRLRFADVVDMGGGDASGTVLGGTGMAVSARSKHVDIAVEFAAFAASAAIQTGLFTQSGGQPGNAKAWEDVANNQLCNGFLQDTRKTIETAWVRPRYDGFLTFQTEGSNTVSSFLAGDITAQACANRLRNLHQEHRK